MPATVWRVGRASDPLRFSEINPEDGVELLGGNRFDVAGGGVLYAATTPTGCYAETLARYRPTAAMRRLRAQPDEHLMETGSVPADWRERRRLVSFGLESPLPFLDVDAPETHTYLTEAMAEWLDGIGRTNLDVAELRGKDRRLTRRVALFAYTAKHPSGEFRYAGIRYESRLGEHECWAIFKPAAIVRDERRTIGLDDESLRTIARQFDLVLH